MAIRLGEEDNKAIASFVKQKINEQLARVKLLFGDEEGIKTDTKNIVRERMTQEVEALHRNDEHSRNFIQQEYQKTLAQTTEPNIDELREKYSIPHKPSREEVLQKLGPSRDAKGSIGR